MNTENLSTLKIHTLSQKQYDRELAAGNIERNAFYLTPDEGKNVYVGTGDMPDDCDFQIDPEGDVLEIPTKVSELENDAGFITLDDLPSGGMSSDGVNITLVDPTLTMEGMAADAKATGDKLRLLEEGMQTVSLQENEDDTFSLVLATGRLQELESVIDEVEKLINESGVIDYDSSI